MKKAEQDVYENKMIGQTIEQVESTIARLSGKISDIVSGNQKIRNNPQAAYLEMKEADLQRALEAYGKVNLSALDVDRIPIVFARLQADEVAARRDVNMLKDLGAGEKDLKKQLEIAKKVLAEKIHPGGRA